MVIVINVNIWMCKCKSCLCRSIKLSWMNEWMKDPAPLQRDPNPKNRPQQWFQFRSRCLKSVLWIWTAFFRIQLRFFCVRGSDPDSDPSMLVKHIYLEMLKNKHLLAVLRSRSRLEPPLLGWSRSRFFYCPEPPFLTWSQSRPNLVGAGVGSGTLDFRSRAAQKSGGFATLHNK